MSITVGFTSSSKRENSTKQLIMSTTHSCTFKNGCSMLTPTLFLELDGNSFPSYTAFKIENRYYKVKDIRSVRNNLFEIDGKIDVLATYKSNILATTAYVLYDTVPNTELVDNRLPMKTSKSVQASTQPFPWNYLDDGCFILSITGSNGSTGIYKLTRGELSDLIDDVNDIKDNIFIPDGTAPDPNDPTYTQDVWGGFRYFIDSWKWLFNQVKAPFSHLLGSGSVSENIRECIYLPFNIGTTIPGSSPTYLGTVPLGTAQSPRQLNKLNNDTVVDDVNVTIPWQASDYRRRSPYTEVYLYMPYIGMTKLSSENLAGQTSVNVKYTIGLKDGTLICTVSSGGEILGQYSGNIACSAPIGISNLNLPKTTQSVIVGAQALASKSIAKAGLAGLQFADSLTPNFSCIGGLDGLATIATSQNITCYTVFHDTNVAPNTEIATIGAPTMAPKSLASLTGYVQTMNASVDGAMTSDERIELNTLLDNGIFIE